MIVISNIMVSSGFQSTFLDSSPSTCVRMRGYFFTTVEGDESKKVDWKVEPSLFYFSLVLFKCLFLWNILFSFLFPKGEPRKKVVF